MCGEGRRGGGEGENRGVYSACWGARMDEVGRGGKRGERRLVEIVWKDGSHTGESKRGETVSEGASKQGI